MHFSELISDGKSRFALDLSSSYLKCDVLLLRFVQLCNEFLALWSQNPVGKSLLGQRLPYATATRKPSHDLAGVKSSDLQ